MQAVFYLYPISTIMEIILWDFFDALPIFLSPQVKRSAIISNKQGVCELPTDLRLKKNQGNLKTCQKYKLMPSLTAKMKLFQYLPKDPEKQKLNCSPRALFHMKTRVCLKYFLNDCRNSRSQKFVDSNTCVFL